MTLPFSVAPWFDFAKELRLVRLCGALNDVDLDIHYQRQRAYERAGLSVTPDEDQEAVRRQELRRIIRTIGAEALTLCILIIGFLALWAATPGNAAIFLLGAKP